MVTYRRLLLTISSALIGILTVTLFFILFDLLCPLDGEANEYTTRYVGTNGSDSGGNDCTNSATPCRTVQYAVDQSDIDDQILVATGIYTGVQARNSMTQVVYISQTVNLLGGYSIDFLTRDPQTYTTTLDAQGEGRVVSIIGASVAPHLEGFIITGGNAHGITTNCPSNGPVTDGCGGGIFIYNASPTIANNIIQNNVAGAATGVHSCDGAGIAMSNAIFSIVSDNLIISNTASRGAYGSGGGIYLKNSTNARIDHNRVFSNVATVHASLPGWGGGIAINGPGMVIQDNVFQGNRDNGGKTGQGAGLYSWNGYNSVAGNILINNHGKYAAYLGSFSNGTFEANQVINNDTEVGIYLKYGSGLPITLTNNIVALSGDKAIMLNGTFANPIVTRLIHNTLVGNGLGYGIFVEPGYATALLTNTIVSRFTWGITNTAPVSSSVFGEHTLFWGNTFDGILGDDPVYGDPRFAAPTNDYLHLGYGSAAIDSGIQTGIMVDIDGDRRPIGPAPDIGADEAPLWVFLPLALR